MMQINLFEKNKQKIPIPPVQSSKAVKYTDYISVEG